MAVFKDKKRNTWFVQYRVKNYDNETKMIKKRGFATKREAQEWELESRKTSTGSLDMTIKSFAEIYINNCKTRIKESTMSTKTFIIENQIVPYLGNIEINKLTTKDVMSWQNRMLNHKDPMTNKQFKKSYLKTLHNQLSAMLNHAVRYYGLPKNVAAVVGNMGSDKETTMNFLTKDEYKKVSEELMDYPMFYYAIEVLYWTGIREGEMLALTLDDIDFKENTISISKTFTQLHGRDLITPPKTRKSNRVIKIPQFLADEIKDYVNMMYNQQPTDRLFPTTKGAVTFRFKKALKAAGIKQNIRIHDLRHSHVSLLIDMGYSAVAIADRVGHESIDITYRYAHLFPNVGSEIANDLDAIKGEKKDGK